METSGAERIHARIDHSHLLKSISRLLNASMEIFIAKARKIVPWSEARRTVAGVGEVEVSSHVRSVSPYYAHLRYTVPIVSALQIHSPPLQWISSTK